MLFCAQFIKLLKKTIGKQQREHDLINNLVIMGEIQECKLVDGQLHTLLNARDILEALESHVPLGMHLFYGFLSG